MYPRVVARCTKLVAKGLGSDLHSNCAMAQGGIGEQLDNRPLELSDARSDVLRDEADYILRDRVLEMIELRFVLEYRDPVLQVRRLDVRDHPPLEAAHETGFQTRN